MLYSMSRTRMFNWPGSRKLRSSQPEWTQRRSLVGSSPSATLASSKRPREADVSPLQRETQALLDAEKDLTERFGLDLYRLYGGGEVSLSEAEEIVRLHPRP